MAVKAIHDLNTRFSTASTLLVIDGNFKELADLLAASSDLPEMEDMAVVIAWQEEDLPELKIEGALQQLVDDQAVAFVVSPDGYQAW